MKKLLFLCFLSVGSLYSMDDTIKAQIDQAQKKFNSDLSGCANIYHLVDEDTVVARMAYQETLARIVHDAGDRMSDTEKLKILHLTGSEQYPARKAIMRRMVEAKNVNLNKELREAVVDPLVDPVCHDDIEFATYLLEHGVQPNALSKTLVEGKEKFEALFEKHIRRIR